jgi:hypothetical protein
MSGADRHLSQTFSGDEVAHALVRAASALMPTLSPDKLSVPHQGVETSLDQAGLCPAAPIDNRCAGYHPAPPNTGGETAGATSRS